MTSVKFKKIADDFAYLEEWEDRYRYLMDLGKALPPYPEDKRDETHRVRGCASQVWLNVEPEPFKIEADSDAHIVKGLVALVLAMYEDLPVSEARSVRPLDELAPLNLTSHLSSQRANGLRALIDTVQKTLNA
jgi:cysteine desulfuration protein SufE